MEIVNQWMLMLKGRCQIETHLNIKLVILLVTSNNFLMINGYFCCIQVKCVQWRRTTKMESASCCTWPPTAWRAGRMCWSWWRRRSARRRCSPKTSCCRRPCRRWNLEELLVYLSCMLSVPIRSVGSWTLKMRYLPGGAWIRMFSFSPSHCLFFCQMMKVRLQQPSGTELAPFNPILPPASITQVLLLANPFKVWMVLVEQILPHFMRWTKKKKYFVTSGWASKPVFFPYVLERVDVKVQIQNYWQFSMIPSKLQSSVMHTDGVINSETDGLVYSWKLLTDSFIFKAIYCFGSLSDLWLWRVLASAPGRVFLFLGQERRQQPLFCLQWKNKSYIITRKFTS